MSGIAGAIDLAGRRTLPPTVLASMSHALRHRGPDGESVFCRDGVHLVSRRLDLSANRSRPTDPNHDAPIQVVFDGLLSARGAAGTSQSAHGGDPDVQQLLDLYERHGDEFLKHLHGQFAFALFDARRQRVLLARDRFGIAPLYVSRQEDWLFFASEIKALLATGMVPARADLCGINHLFTFFGLPGPTTCFEGVSLLLPAHCLEVSSPEGRDRDVRQGPYWTMEFPEYGHELGGNKDQLVDEFEDVLSTSIDERLEGDVPVVAYMSGGADSSLLVALASKQRGGPPPTFTIRIDDPRLDETSAVAQISRRLGCQPTAVTVGRNETLAAYPRLVEAAESPVIDTACAALLLLAEEVQAHGYRAALTGEGADEWMGSYPWFRLHKLLGLLDVIPGVNLSNMVRRLFLRISGAPLFPKEVVQRTLRSVGGSNPWLDIYGLVSLSKLRFFSPTMKQVMLDNNPYADLKLDLPRFKTWHPYNRALALGARVHLPGLLLQAKGDRIARRSAVQMRYPFLDERVFAFLAKLHPRWKMKGLTDKYLLRLLADRHLPKDIAWRRKALFQAPFEGLHQDNAPAFVDQLLSPDSLRATNYFDPYAVLFWRKNAGTLRVGSTQRTSIDMGLAGVFSTQLWHHLFIDPRLADIPGRSDPKTVLTPSPTSLLKLQPS